MGIMLYVLGVKQTQKEYRTYRFESITYAITVSYKLTSANQRGIVESTIYKS